MTLDDYLDLPGAKAPAALAAEIGISESSLSRIRLGKQNTTRDVMLKIIAASGGLVTADALLGLHDVDGTPDEGGQSANNGGEIIGEGAESRPVPFSSPTCSATSAPSALHGASRPCSTSPSADPSTCSGQARQSLSDEAA